MKNVTEEQIKAAQAIGFASHFAQRYDDEDLVKEATDYYMEHQIPSRERTMHKVAGDLLGLLNE